MQRNPSTPSAVPASPSRSASWLALASLVLIVTVPLLCGVFWLLFVRMNRT